MDNDLPIKKNILHNMFPVSHPIVESEKFKCLRISTKCVYFYLCKHSNRFGSKGWFWRYSKRMAADTMISEQTVKKAINELCKNNFIEKHLRYNQLNRRCNLYHIMSADEFLTRVSVNQGNNKCTHVAQKNIPERG